MDSQLKESNNWEIKEGSQKKKKKKNAFALICDGKWSLCPTQAVVNTVLFFLHFLKKVQQIRCVYEFCFETPRT